MAPIFFDYKRTPLSEKKVNIALNNLETYFQRIGTKYAVGGRLLPLPLLLTNLKI